MTAPLIASASAKVNLTLRILGRRADGLHELESLVVFAQVADELNLVPGQPLALDVKGPLRGACGKPADNLVLKAARALAVHIPKLRLGHFILFKRIPVAAGLGGGSADAAAALRLLAKANGLTLDDSRVLAVAQESGADVPVCLEPRPRIMRGVGDVLSGPLELPPLAVVLVNPGVALATKDVFGAFDVMQGDKKSPAPSKANLENNIPTERDALLAYLGQQPNDLEAAAISLQPAIGKVLAALRALPPCRLARMSGSGATCFALCDSAAVAKAAAGSLRAKHPTWWIKATALGGA